MTNDVLASGSKASDEFLGPDVDEGLVQIDRREYYCVPNVERLAPFLMSIVSDGDRWMFISSSGALTAGRKSSEFALFPYETDDRLHDASRKSGPVTSFRINGLDELWRPFQLEPASSVSRRLAKSTTSDAVIFEEDHASQPLTFSYRWSSCEEFGFVRRARIVNRGESEFQISLVDGLVNLLPCGVDPALDLSMRNLTNAYKRSEQVSEAFSVVVYSMESQVSDRPAPSEMLRANTVWSNCPENFNITLDASMLQDFERGTPSNQQKIVTGRPGAYLVSAEIALPPGSSIQWDIVCDVAKSQAEVAELVDRLERGTVERGYLDKALQEADGNVQSLMASADAFQSTGDRVASAYHYSNVLNNCMRGGVPLRGYIIDPADFRAFVRDRNVEVMARNVSFLEELPDNVEHADLLGKIQDINDPQLLRLAYEYLPFSFSRRHGDPSRPWNKFAIQVSDDDGNATCSYEGNWRDIFQNWEALCSSFPRFIPSVISVFVNATTVDGFNPYRISRAGIDWESPTDNDPWANIGYWGDHQIAYLLALLESSERHHPGHISSLLTAKRFSYADVPYRLASFDSLLADPKNTISFDHSADALSQERVQEFGGDGRLLWSNGQVLLVSLAEKLLVPAMSKLANFVPGGGIWMNTQRPEWNDANNALVGNGISVVTLIYLRRYLEHLGTLFAPEDELSLSTEVNDWLERSIWALNGEPPHPEAGDEQQHRFRLMSDLGSAFSEYRDKTVGTGFSGVSLARGSRVLEFLRAACHHLDATIESARRSDGMYQSYNILHLDKEGRRARVEHLEEMLEGQVAILASGLLSLPESVQLVTALLKSDLFREDIGSLLLYPAKQPVSFLSKNVIPEDRLATNELLMRCLDVDCTSVITRDVSGACRFGADLVDKEAVSSALDACLTNPILKNLVVEYRADALEIYEEVFQHRLYTGRSSSMHAFEGIGSVYWHMVAKLLVALQRTMQRFSGDSRSSTEMAALVNLYRVIRSGMGPKKSAADWGAIPTDPYSHSPSHSGAQQPGMTGFAKEEVLARPFELGLRVDAGVISLDPTLVHPGEMDREARIVRFRNVSGVIEDVELPADSFILSCCQIPIVVKRGKDETTTISFSDGTVVPSEGLTVDVRTSGEIFRRTGLVQKIEFTICE